MYLFSIRKHYNKFPAFNAFSSLCWNNNSANMLCGYGKCYFEWFAGNRDLDIDADSGRDYNFRYRHKFNNLRTCNGQLYLHGN
jgi:hypothetical protein